MRKNIWGTIGGSTYVKSLWFELINSGTSGTLTPPTKGIIVLDQWAAGVDALASQVASGQPNFVSPVTSTGTIITATLDINGNWALSGTPSSYPVAVVYVYKTLLVNYDSAYSLGAIEFIPTAAGVNTDVSSFNGNLTSADNTVQKALDTIDNAPLFHARQHSLTSTSDHTSTATATYLLKADSNGLPVTATNTDTQVADTVKELLTGFVNRTDSTLSMSGAYFQVTGTYSFYSDGVKYTKSTAQQVEITNDNTLHYVYFNSAGTLTADTDAWSINSNKALCALVYKTGSTYAIFDERHYYNRNRRWHSWAHYTIGARYYSGFTGTFTDTTLSLTQGVIEDEDIIVDSGATKTACRLWYRNTGGASMTFESNVTTPYKITAGAIKYDNGGSIDSVSNNYYVASYVYATPDIDYPIAVVVGQAQYANNTAGLNSCRAEANPTIPASINVEWKLLYQVIYQNASRTPDYIEANDRRTVSTGPAGSITTNSHAALVDRDLPNQHAASAITNTPAGTISATDVQSAINELDTEKTTLAAVKADSDVASAISLKHAAVTVSAPISVTGQALSLVNDAAATVTEIDTGALANSDTVIPTSKAVTTALASAGVSFATAAILGTL